MSRGTGGRLPPSKGAGLEESQKLEGVDEGLGVTMARLA